MDARLVVLVSGAGTNLQALIEASEDPEYGATVVAVGAATIEAISRIRADVYFMGVTGIHPVVGLSTGDLEEAHVKRALSASAAETIVLASAEKLNAASPFVIAPVTEASEIVVVRRVPEEATAEFERLGITITRI